MELVKKEPNISLSREELVSKWLCAVWDKDSNSLFNYIFCPRPCERTWDKVDAL